MTIPLSGKDWQTINDPEMTVIATAENGQQAIDCFREPANTDGFGRMPQVGGLKPLVLFVLNLNRPGYR